MKLLHALIVSIALLRPTHSDAAQQAVVPVPTVAEPVDPDCIKDGDGWWFLADDGTFAYASTCDKAHDIANRLPPPIHRNSYFQNGTPIAWTQI